MSVASDLGGLIGDSIVHGTQNKPLRTLIRETTDWKGSATNEAVGVAGAESGFNPNAVNNKATCSPNGDRAVGLMQVCTIHKGKYGIPANYNDAVKWLQNPRNNLRAAYAIWQAAGGTFQNDWVTYQNGGWKRFSSSNPLVKDSGESLINSIGDTISGAADALNPVNNVKAAVNTVGDFIGLITSPDTWFRAGKGALGLILVVMGAGALVYMLATKVNANPATKAVKVVKAAV